MLKFSDKFDVHIAQDRILLRQGARIVRIASDGSQAFERLGTLIAPRPREELIQGLPADVAPAFDAALAEFLKAGYLEELEHPKTPHHTPALKFSGSDAHTPELIAACQLAGQRVVDGGQDADVHFWIPGALDAPDFIAEYKSLLDEQVPVCPVLLDDGSHLEIGPVSMNRDSSCAHCASLWRSSGLDRAPEHLEMRYRRNRALRAPLVPALASVLIAIAERAAALDWRLQLLAITVSTSDVVPQVAQHTVLKFPRCEVCGTSPLAESWLHTSGDAK